MRCKVTMKNNLADLTQVAPASQKCSTFQRQTVDT